MYIARGLFLLGCLFVLWQTPEHRDGTLKYPYSCAHLVSVRPNALDQPGSVPLQIFSHLPKFEKKINMPSNNSIEQLKLNKFQSID